MSLVKVYLGISMLFAFFWAMLILLGSTGIFGELGLYLIFGYGIAFSVWLISPFILYFLISLQNYEGRT